MDRSVTAQATEKAVLAVLAGTPLAAAAHIAMDAAELAEAIEAYRAAGRAVLEAQTGSRGWYQVRVEFADWDTAEHAVATEFGPKLAQAETAGVVSSWWYIRKAPCWRLRFHADATPLGRMKDFVGHALDDSTSLRRAGPSSPGDPRRGSGGGAPPCPWSPQRSHLAQAVDTSVPPTDLREAAFGAASDARKRRPRLPVSADDSGSSGRRFLISWRWSPSLVE